MCCPCAGSLAGRYSVIPCHVESYPVYGMPKTLGDVVLLHQHETEQSNIEIRLDYAV